MAALFDPIQVAFQNAMSSFKAELKDDQVYNDMLQITTIDQVYDATDEIQRQQAKEGHLRHLSKVSPYLERLNEYAATIEVFIQVKPDVLALIWGPIKLLLQWTSALKASFDAIVNTMAELGELLPEFKRVMALFDQNAAIKEVMVLFFRDILDIYLVALKFFKLSRWKYLFESLWPKHKEKIKVVMTHIQNHVRLMRNEVRLEHIQQEHEARQRALANFEREEEERRAQEFHRIKTDIAPQSYDDTLEIFRGLVYQGTGLWLLQDATFKQWLNPISGEPRIFWLQGIPGAGKTYLASDVIQKAQLMGHTAFAFISYQRSTTAMSIIHSLIFRLVSGNDDLQAITCQSCNEESKRTLQGAADLLVTILSCTGPAYIIVDGLDEMKETERGRLLTQLMQISKSCNEARLFISSRAEADLVSILGSDATVMQIGQRNLQCIQTFVNRWAQSWVEERGFNPDERAEIELGLEPLAPKSQGMFLYARVVLKFISDLDTFDDIQEQLHTLPESLYDAYGRILKRINSLDSIPREKARRILGWIGCSPTPLRVPEIQQALTIHLNDTQNTKRVRGSLNLVRICGPIVELVDDYVHFVHFTVKEYIFSPDISDSINLQTATLDISLRCMTYLRQGHHDIGLSDEEVNRNLLLGAYTLDWFATTMWPQLVNNYLELNPSQDSQAQLARQLVVLRSTRVQAEFIEEGLDDNQLPHGLDSFKDVCPEAYEMLSKALRFRHLCTASEHRMYPGAPWINFDPLTTSALSTRIHQAAEYLLTHNEENGTSHQQIIRRWYGQRPYKCQYLGCAFNRTGFQEVEQRRLHMKQHDRPWKCSFASCEYSQGGFLSKKMREEHFDRAHSRSLDTSTALVQLNNDDETSTLLIDLARVGYVDSVRALLPSLPNSFLKGTEGCVDAMLEASILSRSLPMVKFCISDSGFAIFAEPAKKMAEIIIQSGNVEILECALLSLNSSKFNYHLDDFYQGGLTQTIILNSPNFIDTWLTYITKIPPRSADSVRSFLRRKELIKLAANDKSRDQLLLRLWRAIRWERDGTNRAKQYYGEMLHSVASTTCSLTLAEYLLKFDVEVDYRRSTKYGTALSHAAKHDTEDAAKLMKWLLLHGADPDIKWEIGSYVSKHGRPDVRKRRISSPARIRDQKGPLGISKWLGISWDELVEQTQGLKRSVIEKALVV
ncbi:NACHT domain protein [Xylaria telfairii]|nr:NACHT domain protein [Xylaria telfairii]